MDDYSNVVSNLKKMVPESILSDPIMSEVTDEFLQEIPQMLLDAREHLKSGNVSETRRYAHQLKGSAGTFGLFSLGDLARDVEDACRNEAPTQEIESLLLRMFDAIGLS